MAKRKLQNEREALDWIEAGRPYKWMVEQYRVKYNIEVSPYMFASLRKRHGLEPRSVRTSSIYPWDVLPAHQNLMAAQMLRLESRRRAGHQLNEERERVLDSWLGRLAERDLVVMYEQDTHEGFWYVPRRLNVDLDLIHEPN